MRKLLPLLGIALFIVSVAVLIREIGRYTISDIADKIGAIPLSRFMMAVVFTFLAYANLTLYDLISSLHLGVKKGYGRTALVSFIAYTFSKNIGFTFLSGTSVRFRMYGKWKVGSGKILGIIVLNYLTFWLGFFALAGVVFTLWYPLTQAVIRVPFNSLQILGAVAIAIYCLYLFIVIIRKKPFRFRNLRFSLPGKTFTLSQTAISTMDWLLSAGVLYFLLPPVQYIPILAVFLLSQFAGLSSQVPGGLGVFEAMTLVILSPSLEADVLIAALLLYRVIFYLIPFLVALILFALEEFLWSRPARQ
ncbi:MAG TPA: lysylphosphatidylglycerol synthase domain-containing protein [Mesotoga infera]|nr:lysylphosphatidylglycerol synthase domain-containing protein [Mesotoga infera]